MQWPHQELQLFVTYHIYHVQVSYIGYIFKSLHTFDQKLQLFRYIHTKGFCSKHLAACSCVLCDIAETARKGRTGRSSHIVRAKSEKENVSPVKLHKMNDGFLVDYFVEIGNIQL